MCHRSTWLMGSILNGDFSISTVLLSDRKPFDLGQSEQVNWRRKQQPTPVLLPGESQGGQSLVGCCLRGRTELDMTEVT